MTPLEARPAHRLMTALIGVVLVLAAGAALVLGEASIGLRGLFSAVSGVLGIEALLRAWQGRSSWISRVGPLP